MSTLEDLPLDPSRIGGRGRSPRPPEHDLSDDRAEGSSRKRRGIGKGNKSIRIEKAEILRILRGEAA